MGPLVIIEGRVRTCSNKIIFFVRYHRWNFFLLRSQLRVSRLKLTAVMLEVGLQKLNIPILFRHQRNTAFNGSMSTSHWLSQNFSAATSPSHWLDLKIVPLAWIILCSQWTSTELLLAGPSRHHLVEPTVLWRIKDNGEDTQAINHYEGRPYYKCRGRGDCPSVLYLHKT